MISETVFLERCATVDIPRAEKVKKTRQAASFTFGTTESVQVLT